MIEPIRFLNLNIEGDRHLPRVKELLLLRRPNVVAMQEVYEDTASILSRCGDFSCHFMPMSTSADNKQKGLLMMWDRSLDFKSVKTHRYYECPKKEEGNNLMNEQDDRDRILHVVELQKGRRVYRVAATHFTWVPEGINDTQRRTFANLMDVLNHYNDDIGIVLSGDFNSPRGLEIFDTLARNYKDNIPEQVKTTIDQSLHKTKGLQLVVDGLFTSPHYSALDVEVVEGVSDHKAIIASVA